MIKKRDRLDGKTRFFDLVYQVVRRIPIGRVTTYGQIARILRTRDARRVGYALHANKDPKVPCHRVVNKDGKLAENFGFDGWKEQKRRLEREGAKVIGKRVDLREYLCKIQKPKIKNDNENQSLYFRSSSGSFFPCSHGGKS